MQQSPEFLSKNSEEIFLEPKKPETCRDLLKIFEQKECPLGKKLKFEGVSDDKTVYNITAPFKVGDKVYIAGRVELPEPEEEKNAKTVFFIEEEDGIWKPDLDLPIFNNLQDPCLTKINGEIIFGGVQTYPRTYMPNMGPLAYRMVFYKGRDLRNLEQFTTGPDEMKGVRLVELLDKKIGVFTRPQGEIGGRGKIGFTTILNSLEEFTIEKISEAKLIEGQFCEDEWGGVNELHILENGTIGVLGHIANIDKDGERHYYAMTFLFDPKTFERSSLKIIATRSNFPPGPAKKSDLRDVIYSGGLVINPDQNTAHLYVGLSDREAGCIKLPNPFRML